MLMQGMMGDFLRIKNMRMLRQRPKRSTWDVGGMRERGFREDEDGPACLFFLWSAKLARPE